MNVLTQIAELRVKISLFYEEVERVQKENRDLTEHVRYLDKEYGYAVQRIVVLRHVVEDLKRREAVIE